MSQIFKHIGLQKLMVKTEQSQIEWRNKERKERKGKKKKYRKTLRVVLENKFLLWATN